MSYRPTHGFVVTLLMAAIAFTLLLTLPGCGGGGDDGCTTAPQQLAPDTSARPQQPCSDVSR